MRYATKASSRVKRQRRRVRTRLIMIGIGTILVFAGLSIPVIRSLKENLSPPPAPYTTHLTTGLPKTPQSTVTFQLSNGTKTTQGSTNQSTGSTSTPSSTAQSGVTGTSNSPEPLTVSPSTITVYSNNSNAQGLKAGLLTTNIAVSAANGHDIEEPFTTSSSGLVLSGSANTPTKTSWSMGVSAQAAAGDHTLALQASSTSGQVYVGSVTVDVVPIPTFSIGMSDIYATVDRGTTDSVSLTDLMYSINGPTPTPTLTVTTLKGTSNITCSSGLSFNSTEVDCSDPAIDTLPDGTTIMEFTFQNQYQTISLGGGIIVTN